MIDYVGVTQADRDAAWPYRPSCYREQAKDLWDKGAYDRAAPIIQAFAHYRLAQHAISAKTLEKQHDDDCMWRARDMLEEECHASGRKMAVDSPLYSPACRVIANLLRSPTVVADGDIDKTVTSLVELHKKMMVAARNGRPYQISVSLKEDDAGTVLKAALELDRARIALDGRGDSSEDTQMLKPKKKAVTLAECPVGLFRDVEYGEICLKTEYGNNEGRIDAYIVASGEFYWGGQPQSIANQRQQMVVPVVPVETTSKRVSKDALVKAAKKARDTFRDYEQQHLAKGTPEGHSKAARNADMAAMLDFALTEFPK